MHKKPKAFINFWTSHLLVGWIVGCIALWVATVRYVVCPKYTEITVLFLCLLNKKSRVKTVNEWFCSGNPLLYVQFKIFYDLLCKT